MVNANILWTTDPRAGSGISNAEKLVFITGYRNARLSESDWTQLPDAVLTEAERKAWQEYRQALRDIPQTYSDPDLVVFPERPA